MTMSVLTMILLVLLLGAGAAIAALGRKLRHDNEMWETHSAKILLDRVRSGDGSPRYEIQVTDRNGLEPDDRRFRWSIWDADLELRLAAYPDADPLGKLGVEAAYMLGDTATYDAAILAADQWVATQGAEFVVMTPMVTAEEPPRSAYANGATPESSVATWTHPASDTQDQQ